MNSVFEIFKIGIGPSSSHTMGPMKAAKNFMEYLRSLDLDSSSSDSALPFSLSVELFGSLASTGLGHGTDKAVILGLMGFHPETIPMERVEPTLKHVKETQRISISDQISADFPLPHSIYFRKGKLLPGHSNGMRYSLSRGDSVLAQKIYYSIGGGFILEEGEMPASAETHAHPDPSPNSYPYAFTSALELLTLCAKYNLTISRLTWENERSQHAAETIDTHIQTIWQVMQETIRRGCATVGLLPGRLEVARRAPMLFEQLSRRKLGDQLTALDWVNLWAIATNEENASGGKIVTAPTNGAAGIIPAVLSYFDRFHRPLDIDLLRDFFLTATAIGSLYKRNASISGAEVGCQGEVGVACSMAAAGLAAILGGSIQQIENAAEIGMEHNLGLTCDPIAGLVQIPCIERNAMGATKAISAARLALLGSGSHKVSLDKVIATMRRTGKDMKTKYKETSKGGLAVNAVDC